MNVEEDFCINTEWEETELLWGKGMYNWKWNFVNGITKEEEKELEKYDGIFGF